MTAHRCPSCGRENPAQGRYCLYCGAALPVMRASESPGGGARGRGARATSGQRAAPAGQSREVPAMLRGDSSGEVSEDLSAGQIVIITARWVLILAGALIALWGPDQNKVGELAVTVFVIILLAFANFYLTLQVLARKPALDTVVYGASAADLAVITAIIMLQGGFKSDIYIFYFPAILAFSVAFPTAITFMFAGAAMALYAFICIGTLGTAASSGDLQVVLTRLLMMAAVAFCGNLYLNKERERRQAAAQAQETLMAQVRERGAASAP